LPLLDSMVPAFAATKDTPRARDSACFVYVPNGLSKALGSQTLEQISDDATMKRWNVS